MFPLTCNTDPAAPLTVYTVGHSNYAPSEFLELVRRHGIEVIADVRSSPYSQYASQFNKEVFEAFVRREGMRYVFLGKELGGRPKGAEFYDAEGYVLYGRLVESAAFRTGIDRLMDGLRTYRVALMCGEEDPADCHRRLLITRVLTQRGVRVLHIRGDGTLRDDEEFARRERAENAGQQLSLFETEEEAETWRSSQSVLPAKPPESSSTP